MALGKALSHWACFSICTVGMWAPTWGLARKQGCERTYPKKNPAGAMHTTDAWEHLTGVGPSLVWHLLDSGLSLPWGHSNFNNRKMTQGLKRAQEWFKAYSILSVWAFWMLHFEWPLDFCFYLFSEVDGVLLWPFHFNGFTFSLLLMLLSFSKKF